MLGVAAFITFFLVLTDQAAGLVEIISTVVLGDALDDLIDRKLKKHFVPILQV